MRFVCNICNSRYNEFINCIDKYNLYRCLKCKLVFIQPQPKLKILAENNLDKYDSFETEKVYLGMENIFTNRAKECIKLLKRFKRDGRLLDVGCSYGFYLKAFNMAGYQTTGLELSKKAIRYARETLGLNIIKDSFEHHKFTDKEFDVITLFDVLEHFSDPSGSFIKIRKILKKGGIIIIQTPNYDSLISRITSTKWFWLLIPQHLFLYSINTLKFFLHKNGFKIMHISTLDDHHEFVSNILNLFGINYYGKTAILHRILIKFKYILIPLSYIWNSLFLGGEILVYARKE